MKHIEKVVLVGGESLQVVIDLSEVRSVPVCRSATRSPTACSSRWPRQSCYTCSGPIRAEAWASKALERRARADSSKIAGRGALSHALTRAAWLLNAVDEHRPIEQGVDVGMVLAARVPVYEVVLCNHAAGAVVK